MYSYISNWAIPRARWPDMEKQAATDEKIFDKALSSGKLVAYGDDINLVHQADGETHDSFWSGMSMAALMGVLDELHKSGASTVPVLASATSPQKTLGIRIVKTENPKTFTQAANWSRCNGITQ